MDPITHPPPHEQIRKLTPRQMDIVALLAEGKTNREISTILSISVQAVKQHVRRMCQKTGAQNRVQLIVMYVRWEVIKELTAKV